MIETPATPFAIEQKGRHLWSEMGFFVPLGIPATLRVYRHEGWLCGLVIVEGQVACIHRATEQETLEESLEGIFEGVGDDE